MEDIGKKDWAESITIFGEQCTNFFQVKYILSTSNLSRLIPRSERPSICNKR